MLILALVATSLPVIERLTPQAQAQIMVIPPRICDPTQPGAANQIIQKCALGASGEYELENSVINDLLSSHKLPQSDRSRLLGWERDAIRAGMYAKLITDIKNGVTLADPMPTLASLVKARRVLAATKALDEYNRWAANCPYIPPGPYFTYLETQCTGLAGLFGRNAPSFEEFQAYGAYLANLEFQNNAAMQESAKNMALGIGLLGGLTATGIATGVLIGTGAAIGALTSALFPFAGVGGAAATIIGVTALAAPVAAILFAVIVGVIRGIQVAGQDEIPGKLQQAKTDAINQTIDLPQLITTDNGRREVLNEFLQATFPDFPATTGVPAASSLDPKFETKPAGGSFTVTPSLQYKDWDGNTHTLRLNGGWFVDRKGSDAERLALSVKFLNGQGRKRQVSRVGSQFLVTDVSDDKAAPVKSVEFEYQDASGNPYVARVVNTAPTVATFDLTRRQELPAPTTGLLGNPTTYNVAQIATIGDSEDGIELLQLTIPAENNGVTISEITVQPDGKVMARVQPSCSATNASFNIQVTDTGGVTASKTLNVTVTPNAAPVLAFAPTQNVVVGNSLTVVPTAGPSDDGGNVHKYDISDPNPFGLGAPTITPLNPSAPAFTGTVTHTTQLGNVIFIYPSGPLDIKNAGPLGSYRVDLPMTDACGLTTTGTFTLNVTCAPITWGTGQTNPTCHGASDGQITVNASGGTGALKYSIDGGQNFQDSTTFNGLSARSYDVVIKDTLGCLTEHRTVTLADPAAVTFTMTPVNPTCNGAGNGQLTINASGGTESFLYSINNGVSFVPTSVFTGLSAKSYNVVVKDTNGCTAASQGVTLTQPAALSLVPNSLPAAQAGVAFSQSFTANGGTGTKTFSLNGSLPNGLSFNNGTLAGTPLQTGSFPLTLTATDQNNCPLTQNLTLTVVCPTVALAPAALPNGDAGAAYSAAITATPAAGNYSFAVTNGQLPPGLSLNTASGLISGTPTQIGAYNFRVTASGSGGFNGCSGFRDYSINITGCAGINVGPATLGGGTVGAAYNQAITASPSAAYSYSVTAGALPAGLSLNASTGAITGTPAQAGAFSFTITAALGGCVGQRSYSVTVGCPTITLPSLGGATAGTNYTGSVAASPSGTYSYSLVTGSLPGGLTLNTSTGALAGTPTVPGSYGFTIKAQAPNGCSGSQAYSLVVACPAITLSALPTPSLNATFNQAVIATPAGGGYGFAVTAGMLPAGLSLNAVTGVINGTPTAAGSYSFTITATKFGSCSGSRTYTGTIAGATCPSITMADLPSGAPGQMYNNSVTASPNGTYSYAVTAGSLPPGLTLYGGFGLLYGYPTTAGTYPFTITATDSNNCTGSKQYSMVIGGASILSLTVNDFGGDHKSDFVLWNATQAQWLIVDSATGAAQTTQWGQAGDLAVQGDYDGDGKADLATFSKDGHWHLKLSKDGATVDKLWGLGTDMPVPGDYDGDGKTDLAVWRGSESAWYILRSSDGRTQTVLWGSSLAPYFDVPVPGDYDGDGKTDIAVFRQGNGHWYIKRSSDGQTVDKYWGMGTDVPVPADYDGDGKTDIAVWRGSEGNWYIIQSSDGAVETKMWGASYGPYFDAPAVGDYDGDGKADVAIWRAPERTWYIQCSRDGSGIAKTPGQ